VAVLLTKTFVVLGLCRWHRSRRDLLFAVQALCLSLNFIFQVPPLSSTFHFRTNVKLALSKIKMKYEDFLEEQAQIIIKIEKSCKGTVHDKKGICSLVDSLSRSAVHGCSPLGPAAPKWCVVIKIRPPRNFAPVTKKKML
jgi:hypothetical protein